MPIDNYGVLKGKVVDKKFGEGDTPHYQIHLNCGDKDFRIAVNVKSQSYPSALLCHVADPFTHPMLETLKTVQPGFTAVESKPNSLAIDYIRGNLFDLKQFKPLKDDLPGPHNDLNEAIDHFVEQSIKDEEGFVYAFGSRWGPEEKADRYFGFRPGNGIHDIHMNQGNLERWQEDDGVWQDGALFFHFPSLNQWAAVFLAFQSQTFKTNDQTGHALG